jgi:dTDP-4-dehydrorhamnose reductase
MSELKRTKPRLLITGGSGFLAVNWACAVRADWEVVLATHRHHVTLEGVTSRPVSLEDEAALASAVREIAPDVVVHTAGLTDVDRCQAEPALATLANATLARNVARAAVRHGAGLVHISTDHLFTGEQPLVTEDTPTQPLNEYAVSKRLAEQWVGEEAPGALIVRTNFFGWGHRTRRSFSDWLIDSLRAHRELSLFDDVHFTPILADRVASSAHALLACEASGIFHVCGDERISKYAFALQLADEFGLPRDLIRRASIAGAGLRAPRPNDMSLSNAKLRAALGRGPVSVRDDLRSLHAQEPTRQPELFGAVTT